MTRSNPFLVVASDPITPVLTLPEAILLTCDALTAFISTRWMG